MEENASSKAFDWTAKNVIDLARVEAGSVDKVKAFLGGLEADLVKILAQNKDLAPGKKQKLQTILTASKDAIGKTYDAIKTEHEKDLTGVAKAQSKGVGKIVNAAVGVDVMGAVLTENQLSALVKDTFVGGHPAAAWWAAQSDTLKTRFSAAINTGYALGEDVDQLARRVRGTKANGYTDGVMQTSRREAEALARTAVQTISNTAKFESFKQLSDTVKGIEWVSTLDTRTTPICRALDGKVWTFPDLKPVKHDKVYPGPIAHWSCRSTQVPVLYSWEELSGKKIKALDGATYAEKLAEKLKKKGMSDEQIAKATANARASMDGQVADTTDMDAWLKKKPEAFVKEVLGPTRADLFQQGKITVSDLTDQRNRPLTISQLEAAIDAGTAAVETEGASFAPFDPELAKPPSMKAAKALQDAAAAKIADVMANPKAMGNSILSNTIAKIQSAEPSLTPAELLAKAEEVTAAKIAANTKSSVLSKAKKNILAGKPTTAAQQALIDDMGDDEKASWLEAVADAKKAKDAENKDALMAANVAKIDAMAAKQAVAMKADDLQKAMLGMPVDGFSIFDQSALSDHLTKTIVKHQADHLTATVDANLAKSLSDDPFGDQSDVLMALYDIDPVAATAVESAANAKLAKLVSEKKKSLISQLDSHLAADGSNLDPAIIDKLDTDGLGDDDVSALEDHLKAGIADAKDGETVKQWKGDAYKAPAILNAETTLGKDATNSQLLAYAKSELTEFVVHDVIADATIASKKSVKAITGMDSPSPHALKNWLQSNGKDAETFLTEWQATKAEKLKQSVNSSVLSKAKKKLAAGEVPTPAQKALIDAMTPEEKQDFVDQVNALKDKQDAQAAAKLAQTQAAIAQQAAQAAAQAAQDAAAAKTAQEAASLANQAAQQQKTAQTNIPHPDDLKIVSSLGGSTGAKLAVDKDGNRYVVKRGAAPDHVRTEQTADDLYRAFGLDVPDGALFETAGGPVKVTRFLEGAQPLNNLSGPARESAFKELRKGFQIDALMGNWDVAGTGLDNVMVTPDGKVWRIDNGGSLKYRAQGAVKSPDAWNRYPEEIWSMRDPANISAPIYGPMDIFQISRQIEAQDFDGLKNVTLDDTTREILEGRIYEMRHLAKRSLDFESDKYQTDYTDRIARSTLDIRKQGISSSMPSKLNVQGTYHLTDENGRAFGNLRSASSSSHVAVTPKLPGDVYGDDILIATKALASCHISGKDVSSGSAPGKMATVMGHKKTLEAIIKSKTANYDEQETMAKSYLDQINALEAIQAAGGIPADVPPQFQTYIPTNAVKPSTQNAKSVVKQWEAMMAAEGINVSPIRDWIASQSGNSWTPDTQALKVAFALGMEDPETAFYWGGNGSHRSSWKKAQSYYQDAVKKAGGAEKLNRLVTSWHAVTQEILSEIDAPWIDRDKRAVLLLRTVTSEEIQGSTVMPDKDGKFIPFRGTTESHSIYKKTSVYGSNLTVQAVPFSRVLATYWTERPGEFGNCGFLQDTEAEFAANTSGIPAIAKNGFNLPSADEKSKDAASWGVPIDHLRK